MSRLSNAISEGLYDGNSTPSLDPTIGVAHGYLPEMQTVGADGVAGDAWVNSKHYTKRNSVPRLLDYPRGFDFFGEEKKARLIKLLKSLVEKEAITIEGLNSGLEVNSDETDSGINGQMYEDITGTTRQRTDVTYTFKDRELVPFRKFFTFYIQYLIEDPDTKSPLVISLDSFDDINLKPKIWTPDYFTFSTMYYEPDITNRHVVEGWIVVNQFPHGNGDVTGRKQAVGPTATEDMTVRFGGLALHNAYTRDAAQKMLDSTTVIKQISDNIKIISEANAGVKASEVGFNIYKG